MFRKVADTLKKLPINLMRRGINTITGPKFYFKTVAFILTNISAKMSTLKKHNCPFEIFIFINNHITDHITDTR